MADTSNPSAPTVVLFPGQGAQHVGMGKAWHDQHAAAKETFAAANAALGIDLAKICFEGPEDQLNRTDIAQAAIYTTGVACYRSLVAAKLVGEPLATAGLSLGEFTALHIAGAFDFVTGLHLVRKRGQYMQEAAEAVKSSMVALIGSNEEQANEVCKGSLAGLPPSAVLVPANFNAPGQVVISGTVDACERSLAVASQKGLQAKALTVAGAFHSPIMQPAAARLAKALDEATWHAPRIPVVSNVTGQPHDPNPDSIKRRMVEQLTSPVRWEEGVRWLVANVKGRYIEPAPGKVLMGLMRRIDRGTRVDNFAEP